MNVLIIDDEKNCVDALTMLLHKCDASVHVLETAHSVDSGLDMIRRHAAQTDILFLDIQLIGGSGFSVLEALDEIPFRVVFTTAYDKYAINAIRFSALDYLLKPIDSEELAAALRKYNAASGEHNKRLQHLREGLTKNKAFEKLAVPSLTDISFIPLHDIIYLQSDNNYTTIYLDDKSHIVSSRNIGYYEDMLTGHGFCRVHNSYIVNVGKVRRFIKGKNGMLELDNGVSLEVSGKRKEELFALLRIGTS